MRPRAGDAANSTSGTELDKDLLLQCRNGDPDALHAFVKCYERRVYMCISRWLGPDPHVDDLAQDTFVRAFEAIQEHRYDINRTEKMSSWLLTIAYRLTVSHRRRHSKLVFDRDIDIQSTDASPEDAYVNGELRRAIQDAVNTLPPDQRDAFESADAGHNRLEGPRETTMRTRLHRARLHLQGLLLPWRKS